MAPNISGVKVSDQARAIYLVELAIDFAKMVLREEGSLLVKAFAGSGFDECLQTLRQAFKRVVVRKPKASRPRSRETGQARITAGLRFKQPYQPD